MQCNLGSCMPQIRPQKQTEVTERSNAWEPMDSGGGRPFKSALCTVPVQWGDDSWPPTVIANSPIKFRGFCHTRQPPLALADFEFSVYMSSLA